MELLVPSTPVTFIANRITLNILMWVIPVVLSKYEYLRNYLFVYSHKTQLCTIKYVYYVYYKDMFRPTTAIIRLYMKTSSMCTIDRRPSGQMDGPVNGTETAS